MRESISCKDHQGAILAKKDEIRPGIRLNESLKRSGGKPQGYDKKDWRQNVSTLIRMMSCEVSLEVGSVYRGGSDSIFRRS